MIRLWTGNHRMRKNQNGTSYATLPVLPPEKLQSDNREIEQTSR